MWDSLAYNTFTRSVHETLVEMFPEDPPAFLTVPYEYHDISRIKSELQDAGFRDIYFSVMPRESRAPSAREVVLAFATGTPLAVQLAARSAGDAATAAVQEVIRAGFGDGAVAAPMQAITIVAGTTDVLSGHWS